MNVEAIVRRNQFREGFELVDYAEVGLPVFRLAIEAVTMARRPIPTIDEFVMRAIGMGETQSKSIAKFLGLGVELVDASLRLLRAGGLIGQTEIDSGENRHYSLLELGRHRLAEGAQYEPQEEMLVVDFDGIRRRPFWLGTENLVRASELVDAGSLEVRPYPASPPDVGELRIAEIATVIRRQAGNAFARDILALKRVVRRTSIFRNAIALVFRNSKSKEVQIGFVVGGRSADDYELEFAARGGPHKMGLIRQIEESEGALKLRRRLGSKIWAELPDPRVIAEQRMAVQEANDNLDALLRRADAHGGTERLSQRALGEVEAARERFEAVSNELTSFPLRPLAPYEQTELLESALETAESRLLISSEGLNRHIADGRFLRALDFALERGVRITIATMLRPSTDLGRPGIFDPLVELTTRSQRSMYFTLSRLRRTESLFCLVKDEDCAVLSNRPFLGDRARRPSLFCVNGIVTAKRDIVDRIATIFDEGLLAQDTG